MEFTIIIDGIVVNIIMAPSLGVALAAAPDGATVRARQAADAIGEPAS